MLKNIFLGYFLLIYASTAKKWVYLKICMITQYWTMILAVFVTVPIPITSINQYLLENYFWILITCRVHNTYIYQNKDIEK